jgi:hypothetical protein
MADQAYAMKFRDLIRTLVVAELERARPKYRYATVVTIDRVNRRATVRYQPSDPPFTVNMGAVQPSAVGQRVRIDGYQGDRFISDVLGPPTLAT